MSALAPILTALLDPIDAVAVPAPDAQPVPAAVLVALDAPSALRDPARELASIGVVLTKRRAGLRRHAGEISFPGGRFDPSDRTLCETALREAEEEIGLRASEIAPLGALSVVHTLATNYVIQPFVALVDLSARAPAAGAAEARWRTSANEVEEVLELSLSEIEAGRGRTRLERRGISFETGTFTVGAHLIWGATFRILDDLLGRLRNSA